eukprot:gene700-1158_t
MGFKEAVDSESDAVGFSVNPVYDPCLSWNYYGELIRTNTSAGPVKVVQWMRTNTAKQVTSMLFAANCKNKNGVSAKAKIASGVDCVNKKVTVDPQMFVDAMLRYIRFYHAEYRKLQELVGVNGQVLTMTYERLLSDPQGEMQRLFNHLGLPEAEFSGRAVGPSAGNEDLSKVITNFDELEEALWPYPCLTEALHAKAARNLPLCDVDEIENLRADEVLLQCTSLKKGMKAKAVSGAKVQANPELKTKEMVGKEAPPSYGMVDVHQAELQVHKKLVQEHNTNLDYDAARRRFYPTFSCFT